MSKKVKIGLLQANFRSAYICSIPGVVEVNRLKEDMQADDFRFNHELLITLTRQAAQKGAQLIISPESYLDGWSANSGIIERAAATIPGPEVDELCSLAHELKVWMCVGLFEKTQDGIFNSSILISSEGKITGIYRKTHETKDVLSSVPYKLGDKLDVYETPWGTIGMLICHDRWYPENARTLALKGAKLVLNPTASAVLCPNHPYSDIHRSVLKSHAYLNSIFWVCCSSANQGGHSIVIGLNGNVMSEGSGQQEVIMVDIDIGSDQGYDFLSNLRPNIYA